MHCIGKAGDAFICNYMTAHFVAPNTCPNIRYACYFRIRGPAFDEDPKAKEAMLYPNIHLHLEGAMAASRLEQEAKNAKIAEESLDLRLVRAESARFQNHYLTVQDSDHTIPKTL